MTNEGVVTKLLPNSMAEVAVARSTACGGNCGSCEACAFQSELKTAARNLLGAVPGQRVIIETSSRVIFGAALLVYIMPLVFFIVGYALASYLGASEGICVLVSFVFLAASAILLVYTQRVKKNKSEFQVDIIEICGGQK